MSRSQDRYPSRSRSLNYGTASSFGSSMSNQYNPYLNYCPSSYRNYNPYSSAFGRNTSAHHNIYGGTNSGYGGVYLNRATLGSLNLMTPVLKKLDKRLVASQKNFKPKPVPLPVKVVETQPAVEQIPPPVRPERKQKANRNLSKEKSRSLGSLEQSRGLDSRSLSLTSLASDGYCSGSERADETDEPDYKALYEASASEVRRLRSLLVTSEQQLREARATITRVTQLNQNSLSEIEKREKRAMERKLSEMEEELKQLQKLKAENERLRAENRALTRVVTKLTNSAAK